MELNAKNNHFTNPSVMLANNPVIITKELNIMISVLVVFSISKIKEISSIKKEQLAA
jgi:hypothetical protein